jgi:hypothetical protein
VLILMALALYTLGRRSDLSSFDVLLLLVSVVMVFRSQRDVWFATLGSLAVLVRGRPEQKTASDRPCWTWAQVLAVAGGCVVVAVFLGWKRDLSAQGIRDAVAVRFPASAAAVVEQRSYPGPLFNSFDWGGYLIWSLPRLRVSIDGRTNLHGDERLRRSVKTWSGLPGWDRDPDLVAARLVIAQVNTPLAELLRCDRRFQWAFEDKVAVVFTAMKVREASTASQGQGHEVGDGARPPHDNPEGTADQTAYHQPVADPGERCQRAAQECQNGTDECAQGPADERQPGLPAEQTQDHSQEQHHDHTRNHAGNDANE